VKVSEAYDKYLIKSEKNSINDGLSTDKGRFVVLYNEYQNRVIEYIYEKKNEDDIRYIQTLLVESYPIKYSNKKEDSYLFKLPENYFDLSTVYGNGSKNSCVNQKIDLFEIKDFDRNYILSDEFTSPSFEYREAPYIISDNNVKIFTNDFTIDSIILSYYRYPLQVRLLDSNNPESDFDDTFDLDFDDKVIDRIISASVGGFDLNNNSERWQLNNLSAKTEL
jgi:hypothetical protein